MKLSIRLQLTLWYSLILIITSVVYIVLTNVVVANQLQRDPRGLALQLETNQSPMFDRQAVRQILDQVHQQDIERVRFASIFIFLALMGLSCIGGYVIAGRTLRPLYTSLDLQQQFIANASHELKTPLSISQTNIEAVLRDPQLPRAELEQYLRQAITSTTFMNKLIEDLLLLSVIDQQIEFAQINPVTITENAVTQLQPLAERAGKTIILHNQVTRHFKKHGQDTLWQRAIMNCIENAIKYSKEKITVSLSNQADRLHITVQDDGIGIPPEALTKVTDRFYRVDQSRSRTSGGTGLGLAITQAIVEHHHGQLNIQSKLGQGTTVTITI